VSMVPAFHGENSTTQPIKPMMKPPMRRALTGSPWRRTTTRARVHSGVVALATPAMLLSTRVSPTANSR
jgi:hypothetical protein